MGGVRLKRLGRSLDGGRVGLQYGASNVAKKRAKKSLKKGAKRKAARPARRRSAATKTARKRSLERTRKAARRSGRKRSRQVEGAAVTHADVPRGMTPLAADAGSALVVVEMSNNGPHDIRAITVDQVHVVENVASTSARTEFDISAHFHPPTRIGWEIFAGIQFPRAGVFLERPRRPPETLGQQAPLKKGVPWLDEKQVN
jgi:hypothetical protein